MTCITGVGVGVGVGMDVGELLWGRKWIRHWRSLEVRSKLMGCICNKRHWVLLMHCVGMQFHRVMIEGSGKTWKQDQRVRIQHVDTGAYLHSHDKKYQRIAGGQQEVRIMKSNPIFQISHSKWKIKFQILFAACIMIHIFSIMITPITFAQLFSCFSIYTILFCFVTRPAHFLDSMK